MSKYKSKQTKSKAFILDDIGLGFPISLAQTSRDRFTVAYGRQVKEGLIYEQAARELGECIMHALACAGNIEQD